MQVLHGRVLLEALPSGPHKFHVSGACLAMLTSHIPEQYVDMHLQGLASMYFDNLSWWVGTIRCFGASFTGMACDTGTADAA